MRVNYKNLRFVQGPLQITEPGGVWDIGLELVFERGYIRKTSVDVLYGARHEACSSFRIYRNVRNLKYRNLGNRSAFLLVIPNGWFER